MAFLFFSTFRSTFVYLLLFFWFWHGLFSVLFVLFLISGMLIFSASLPYKPGDLGEMEKKETMRVSMITPRKSVSQVVFIRARKKSSSKSVILKVAAAVITWDV